MNDPESPKTPKSPRFEIESDPSASGPLPPPPQGTPRPMRSTGHPERTSHPPPPPRPPSPPPDTTPRPMRSTDVPDVTPRPLRFSDLPGAIPRPMRPMPPPPPAGPPPVRIPVRRQRVAVRVAEEQPKGKGKWILFLLFNLVLIGMAVFWFTRPEEVRKHFVSQVQPGVAARAIAAGLALLVLVVCAKVVLPGARAAVRALTQVGMRFPAMPPAKRVLLFPAEAGVDVAWTLAQVFFVLDVVAILLSSVLFVLYVVKIAKPDLFPFLP